MKPFILAFIPHTRWDLLYYTGALLAISLWNLLQVPFWIAIAGCFAWALTVNRYERRSTRPLAPSDHKR